MHDTLLYVPFLLSVPVLLFFKPTIAIQVIIGVMVVFNFTYRYTILANIGSISIHNIDVVAASLSVFIVLAALRRDTFPRFGSVVAMMLLLCWGVIGILRGLGEWGPSALHGARSEIVPMIAFFAILCIFRPEKGVAQTIHRFALIVFIAVVVNWIDYYFLGGREANERYTYDVRKSARFLGASEVLPVAFLFVAIIQGAILATFHRLKGPTVFLIVLCAAAVILTTQHRSVWAATLVGLFVVWLRTLVRPTAFMKTMTLICCVGIAVSILVLLGVFGFLGEGPKAFAEHNLAFLRGVEHDTTGSWRWFVWRNYLEKSWESPLMGHGLGPPMLIDFGTYQTRIQAHNSLIMYFYHFGIVGVLMLATAFVTWMVEMQRFIRTEENGSVRGIAIALQTSAVMTVTYEFFYRQHPLLWFILGLGSALVAQRWRKSFSMPTRMPEPLPI